MNAEPNEDLYFQFLVGLKEQVLADNDDITKLPDVLAYLHTIGPKLDEESQEKALNDIAEIMQISTKIGRLEIAGLISVVGSAIIQEEKVFSKQYTDQVYNLFMNCLNIARPILTEYIKNPDINPNELRRQEPERHFAYDVLDDVWRAMHAILVHSEPTRKVLKTNQQLLDFLGPYVGYHDGCKQIHEVLQN